LLAQGCQSTVAETQEQQQVYEQAKQWYLQGDLLTAEQQLNRLHLRQLDTPQSWRLLGNIQFRQQRLAAAEQAYQQALRYDANDRLSWHNLALVRLRQTTATLMQARAELGELSAGDAVLLDQLLKLQRVALP
jgi:predicted Zn-dependent protease